MARRKRATDPLDARIAGAARRLYDAHRGRERFAPLPPDLAPRSVAEAYAIQDVFVALRADDLGPIAGHKIALTTPQMRKMCGIDQPIAGAMLEPLIRRSPARVRAADYVNLLVEFEIALELADDLPVADAPFSRERVAQAVGAVMPAFELLDDRGADYATLGRFALQLVAENAWNEGAVLGKPVRDWRKIDLAAVRGVASLNGKKAGEGRGADAMGHPLDALAWIADHLAASGRGLWAGEVVITGSLVTPRFPKAGDALRFALEGLGEIELGVE